MASATRLSPIIAPVLIAACAGVVNALFAPRGPTTGAQALAVMGLGLIVGIGAARLGTSRWLVVLLTVAYLTAFEAARLGTSGPTVTAIRLDTPYGVIAFLITRVLHLILVALPLCTAVLLVPRRGSSFRPRVGVALVGFATVMLTVAVALPASTPQITDEAGQKVPGSIAELTKVRLGASDQFVMIRAADPNKPVLLYLAGGPGQSDLALARAQVTGWEREFVFVDLDQRGNGKSYQAIDPVSSLTVDQAVDDVIQLTEYLCARFEEKKIYLMGESWGTILGVLAVQRRPDLYYAWIGSGQMVNVLETDRRVYRDLGAYARRVGDDALLAKLREIGDPPYRDIPWANANLLEWYELLYPPYTPSEGYLARGADAGLDPFGVLGTEYDLIEKTNVLRGLIDTFTLLYPQLYDLDLRERVTSLEVPVYQLDGAAELDGRRSLALEWFARLRSPAKELVTYANAAHAVAFEQADDVQRLLTDTIVPATYGR